ncbi:MAG: MgtC/SapB family protein [Clostridiaceae bacterium]|nr:MgtC/SapB family protein [Clostridiaceae bacterium]
MGWHLFQFEPQFVLIIAARLLVACVLGGIVGFEREHTRHKPAGFRTHILVCMGACLVTLISEFAVKAFSGVANVDPTRIGAQVVSGIGFLGAGAIIRHGISVRGITTAASVWAVACVGIACGMGFYTAALLATLLIWAVLTYLKVIKSKMTGKRVTLALTIESVEAETMGVSWEKELKELGLNVESIDISRSGAKVVHKIICRTGREQAPSVEDVSRRLMNISGVTRVSI